MFGKNARMPAPDQLLPGRDIAMAFPAERFLTRA